MNATTPSTPFTLPRTLLAGLPRRLGDAVLSTCERLLALPALDRVYTVARKCERRDAFCDAAIGALGARYDISDADLARIPTSGPLIVVANHPLGGLDGLMLASILRRVRPDVRLLANHLLAAIPEMHDTCIFVDPFGGEAARRRNRDAMLAATRWLRDGGALGMFPAGEVSHYTMQRGYVADPSWSATVARLIRRTRATVVPMHFAGANSRLFQLAGLAHPRLRTMMLPRELLAARGKCVQVRVGSAISCERLERRCGEAGDGAREATRRSDLRAIEYLRARTYILGGRDRAKAKPARVRAVPRKLVEPIAPIDESLLAADVAALPPERTLGECGELSVLWAAAAEVPHVLREIGRLREVTFRAAGEGTGREIDLDRFDAHYLHLFVWNATTRRVIGAYRMGQTDVLLDRFGVNGLYTSTLFRYSAKLMRQIDPALELGRSFVALEYQRDYSPLLLLWKGIGRFVTLHPRYRHLFGAVSISDEYQSTTRQLLMSFLRAHNFDHELAAHVRPKHPPRELRGFEAEVPNAAAVVSDLADVEELIGEIESDGRGVPVLLRQYLKLNARMLGFNVDSTFGDVLDGLVLVDLMRLEPPLLKRYLGRDGAAAFLEHQRAINNAS
ncbi:MAG: lysophospholipid acyltransferase family protein [Phycisphaerae bacterium]